MNAITESKIQLVIYHDIIQNLALSIYGIRYMDLPKDYRLAIRQNAREILLNKI